MLLECLILVETFSENRGYIYNYCILNGTPQFFLSCLVCKNRTSRNHFVCFSIIFPITPKASEFSKSWWRYRFFKPRIITDDFIGVIKKIDSELKQVFWTCWTKWCCKFFHIIKKVSFTWSLKTSGTCQKRKVTKIYL